MVKKMENKYIERITTGSDTNLVNATGAVSKSNPTHPFDDMGKQASFDNQYLEKLALTYNVRPHSDDGDINIDSVLGNSYLEKLAANQEDLDYAMGSGTNRFFTGAVGINNRLKEKGYDSTLDKVSKTSLDGTDWKTHIGQNLGGAAIGAGAGALVTPENRLIGALVGGLVGVIVGSDKSAYDHWKRGGNLETQLKKDIAAGKYGSEKQASFGNPYLEKIAANKYKQHLESKGMSFGDSRAGGASNASIMASHASTAPSNSFRTGGSKIIPGKSGFMGLGKTSPTRISDGKIKVTGDSTLNKSLGKRLEDFKANKATIAANAEKTGVKGILGKAVGLIKRNPLTAAGAALGAGILAGRSGNRDQVQYQYA